MTWEIFQGSSASSSTTMPGRSGMTTKIVPFVVLLITARGP